MGRRQEEPTDSLRSEEDEECDGEEHQADVLQHEACQDAQTLDVALADKQSADGVDGRADAAEDHLLDDEELEADGPGEDAVGAEVTEDDAVDGVGADAEQEGVDTHGEARLHAAEDEAEGGAGEEAAEPAADAAGTAAAAGVEAAAGAEAAGKKELLGVRKWREQRMRARKLPMMEAQAEPSIPVLRTTMKSRSKSRLARALSRTACMTRRGLPSVLTKLVTVWKSIMKSVPQSMMRR